LGKIQVKFGLVWQDVPGTYYEHKKGHPGWDDLFNRSPKLVLNSKGAKHCLLLKKIELEPLFTRPRMNHNSPIFLPAFFCFIRSNGPSFPISNGVNMDLFYF